MAYLKRKKEEKTMLKARLKLFVLLELIGFFIIFTTMILMSFDI